MNIDFIQNFNKQNFKMNLEVIFLEIEQQIVKMILILKMDSKKFKINYNKNRYKLMIMKNLFISNFFTIQN